MSLRSEHGLLVDQAPMIIWRSDTTGKRHGFDERCLAITGRTLQQEVGDGCADGAHRWILDHSGAFHDVEGTFLRCIGTCLDLTDRVERPSFRFADRRAGARRISRPP